MNDLFFQNAIDTTVDSIVSEDLPDVSASADVEMKDEEVKNEVDKEIVKEEEEPAPDASTNEEMAVEEKPVVDEPAATESMEVEEDSLKEGNYQVELLKNNASYYNNCKILTKIVNLEFC